MLRQGNNISTDRTRAEASPGLLVQPDMETRRPFLVERAATFHLVGSTVPQVCVPPGELLQPHRRLDLSELINARRPGVRLLNWQVSGEWPQRFRGVS